MLPVYSTFEQLANCKQGWDSLISKNEKRETQHVLTDIFDEYATRLNDPLFPKPEENRSTYSDPEKIQKHYRWIMRSVISDLFLKYLILSKDPKFGEQGLETIKMLECFSLFLEKNNSIINKIKKIVNKKFNPHWQCTQSIISYEIQKKLRSIEILQKNKTEQISKCKQSKNELDRNADRQVSIRMNLKDELEKKLNEGTLDKESYETEIRSLKERELKELQVNEETIKHLIEMEARIEKKYNEDLKAIQLPDELESLTSKAGVKLMDCWVNYPRLRYILIHNLHLKWANKKCSENKKNLGEYYTQDCLSSLNMLNPKSPDYQKEYFYFTLLNHHKPLLDKIPIMLSLFYRVNVKHNEGDYRRSLKTKQISPHDQPVGSEATSSDSVQTVDPKRFPAILMSELLSSDPRKALQFLDDFIGYVDVKFPVQKNPIKKMERFSRSFTHPLSITMKKLHKRKMPNL